LADEIRRLGVVVDPSGARVGSREVVRSLDDIRRSARSATGKDGIGGIQNAFQKLRSYVFSVRGLFAGLGVGLVSKQFIEAAATTEQYRLRLKALTGSGEEANRMFDDMSKFAGSVPFEYKDIMGAATQLTGIMKGGADEVRQWMPLIADLAAVTGLGIEQTTSQVVRMYSAGAASADLFRERGVLAMLGFQSGVSVSAEETRKKLMAAWEDPASKFRGLTKELAGTWQGLLSMFSDRWFLFRSRVMEAGPFDAIKSKLADLLEKINEFVEKGDFDRWADKTARAILITASAAATLAKILVVGGLMYVGLTTTIRLTQAAATAYDLLRLRLHLAKMEAVTYNSTMVVLNTTLWGTSLAATAAAGAIGKLKIALGVLFAFYAGWKIGEWLRENFLEAQLAGIWMVRVLMKGWEQLKYSADIAFTGILGLWNTVMKFMTDTFASLLEIIATGLEGIPVIGPKLAAPLQSLADELREAASSTEPLADALARIDKKHEEAKRHIEEVTDEMAAEAVAAWNAKDAINKEADEVDRSGKIHGEASKQVKKLADTYDELVRKAKSARLELQQPEEDRSRFRLEADYAEKRKKFEEDRDKLLKAEPAKTDTQKHANWLASVELMRSQELKIDQWFLEESLSLMIEGRRRRDEQYRKDIMDIRERAGEEREERQRFADIQKDDEIRRFEAMSRVGREAALREMEDKKSQIEELNRLNEMRAKVAVGRGEMSEAEATRQHYEGLRQVVEQEKAIAEAQYIIADNDSERLAAIYRMHEAKRKLLSIDAEESIRAKELKGVWKDLSESMEKMFDNTVYGVIQGTFDIRKEFQNMVNDILRMWVRMVSKIVVQKAILGIGSLFTGGPTPLQLSGPYAGGGVDLMLEEELCKVVSSQSQLRSRYPLQFCPERGAVFQVEGFCQFRRRLLLQHQSRFCPEREAVFQAEGSILFRQGKVPSCFVKIGERPLPLDFSEFDF
jgi:hypothetical protein